MVKNCSTISSEENGNMMEMDGKTEALFTSSKAQTKLRRNLPQLKLVSTVGA